ncbi:branched-chain amino acid ABC transporter [Caballeronia fortuita]|uniref:Branched-chain amino acid ABC transporter n=1 Tax=Caballeronia fortuita TaxID=1777138 RepID=A0A158CBD0_9BURK|nr:ABC transporter ATP-binding protein [Caballeronia fortuita]SAK79581.1 branched-chain amino acid ABC transporter [Caballeronia fortuita]
MDVLLELRDVRKSFGATQVIKGLSFSVNTGEFVGVIGPNGAGKSTAFGLIAGHLRSDTGSILFDGDDVTSLGADARCRAGIGRTFQVPQPFAGMTVFENALVAATYGAELTGRKASFAAHDAIDRCGLSDVRSSPAGSLTLLQRKRLELARALATSPRLLLLDEVGGGLTDSEVAELLQLVRGIHSSGVTVIWIEHLVHALVSVAERLVVLTEGSLLADGKPTDVINSKIVRETYLGEELAMEEEVPPLSPPSTVGGAHAAD